MAYLTAAWPHIQSLWTFFYISLNIMAVIEVCGECTIECKNVLLHSFKDMELVLSCPVSDCDEKSLQKLEILLHLVSLPKPNTSRCLKLWESRNSWNPIPRSSQILLDRNAFCSLWESKGESWILRRLFNCFHGTGQKYLLKYFSPGTKCETLKWGTK